MAAKTKKGVPPKQAFTCNVGNMRELLKQMYADELPVRVKLTVEGKLEWEVAGMRNEGDRVVITLK